MSDLSVDALGHPLEFPPEFKQWLTDYVATQIPKLPISQVFGFQLQRGRTATVDTSQTRANAAYGDLATVGPTLTNLANGWYLLFFGCDVSSNTAFALMAMSPEVNGVAAVDADMASTSFAYSSPSSILRVLMVHLNTVGGANTITMKYRAAAGTGTFSFRFLHAIKVVTLDE